MFLTEHMQKAINYSSLKQFTLISHLKQKDKKELKQKESKLTTS